MVRRSLFAAVVALVAVGCAPDPPSSVVGVLATGCAPSPETGSGVVVAPGVVLTSAHVIAGATGIEVVRPGWSGVATVAAFDDENDLAYLHIDALPGPALRVSSDAVENGHTGVAYVMRDGEPVAVPITVERRVRIETKDIYREGTTSRPGFVLDGDIEPGDSGGPVFVDGRVAAVVWARSTEAVGRAYAIDAGRGRESIDDQLTDGIPDDVDLTRCTN